MENLKQKNKPKVNLTHEVLIDKAGWGLEKKNTVKFHSKWGNKGRSREMNYSIFIYTKHLIITLELTETSNHFLSPDST